MSAKVIRMPGLPVTIEDVLDSIEETTGGEKKPRSFYAMAVDEHGQCCVWACGNMADLPFVALNFEDLALRHINGMIFDQEE